MNNAIGYIKELDTGNTFPVYPNPSYGIAGKWGAAYPHIIITDLDSAPLNYWGWRYANVLKTVARIVVDESDDCQPVVEKWRVKFYQ